MAEKQEIIARVNGMRRENEARRRALTDRVSLSDYAGLCGEWDGVRVWGDALQTALAEHETVVIPPADEPYLLEKTVTVPSNRCIDARGAVIRLADGVTTLMLRNEHTADGTHAPIPAGNRDENITVLGGRWEEYHTARAGYGRSGKYDEERSFFGVSTCMLFGNLDRLTLSGVTFAHTAGFAVQCGDLSAAVFEEIRFDCCYADGLHLNGNMTDVLVRDVKGQVGDDLVALNMYDWQNSSVNFGPMRNVLCEDLELTADSRYKAIRIEPGLYTYRDGSTVDCSLTDAVIRRVRGIKTFKLYFQTPRYRLGTSPEPGGVGSADNLYFEDIVLDLDTPIDRMPAYMDSDPRRGTFAAFELGANIGRIRLEKIDLTLHRQRFPLSYLACIGPKSVRREEWEIFDPYLSSHAARLELCDIRINGQKIDDPAPYLREIAFDDINGDGHSTGRGTFGEVILEG